MGVFRTVEITATNGVEFYCWANFAPADDFIKAKQGELGSGAKPGSNLGSGERWI